MDALARFCTDNPLRVVLMALCALALGVLAWRSIPLEYLYDPSPPQLVVVVRYPGATAELASANVAVRLEAELRAVPGVRRLVSRSVDGSVSIAIDFDRKLSFVQGERDVRERVGRVRYQLPREVRDPEIFQVGGGNDQAVLEIAVGSERLDRAAVTEWVASVARPRLESVPGVGDLSLSGDAPRQLEILFDPDAAAALGVSLEEVVAAIRRENVDVRTGHVNSPSQQRILRVAGRLSKPGDFEQIAVRRDGPLIIRLGDVARAGEGAAEPTARVRYDGRDSISIKVFPLRNANVAEVAARLRSVIGSLQSVAPPGISVSTVVDNSEYAQASLAAVERAMFEGAALTILLVALCLRSLRSSFITALTLPLSVLGAVTLLWALGYSLNLFTLLALTLAIGVLIDDAIVVRESIVRHLQAGALPRVAAVAGTVQLARAVASTTLVIVAVFLPLLLARGPLGPFITQFGLTVAIAVSVSLLVCFTVDPALSVMLAHRGERARPVEAAGPHWTSRATQLALRFRTGVAFAAAVLMMLTVWLFRALPTELLPEFDEGLATLTVQLPVGSSSELMLAKAAQAERALREFPEVVNVLTGVGTARSRNVITLFIRLTPPDRRTLGYREIEDRLRQRLDRIAGITTSPTSLPVSLLLSGPDDVELDKLRRALVGRLAPIRGLSTVVSSDLEENQAIVLEVNRDRLADAGASLEQLAGTLGAFVSGAPISTWHSPSGRQYDIAMRFPKASGAEVSALHDIELVSGTGAERQSTPLRAVADIRVGDRQRVIERVDGTRLVRIQAAVSGRSLGEVGAEVRQVLAGLDVPRGYQVAFGGKIRELEDSQNDFMAALGLAVLLVFCVLAVFFGGVLVPLVIMAAIPLGCLGALAWLWISGGTLNVFSGVGLLLVSGLVAKNGILLVDFARHAEQQGATRHEAIVSAVAQRARPILMTSGAMLVGMLPMAFGMGHGGEQLSATGQAIVSGIIVSTGLSLLVVPALYALLPAAAGSTAAASGRSMAGAAADERVGV